MRNPSLSREIIGDMQGAVKRRIALMTVLHLTPACLSNQTTEAPEGNEKGFQLDTHKKEYTCEPLEKLSGEESLLRHPVDVRARILAMKEYTARSGISFPEFDFQEREWDLIGPQSKRQVLKRVMNYCYPEEAKGFGVELYTRGQIDHFLSTYTEKSQLYTATVEDSFFTASSPLLEVSCDLSVKNKDYEKCVKEEGEGCEEKPRTKSSGLYIERAGRPFILVYNIEDIGVHEAIHLYNVKWEIGEKYWDRLFPAASLLNPKSLELSGFRACDGIHYEILNEGGADAAQIALTNFKYAKKEIISGATEKARKSNYQMKFYVFKHLFFEKLGNEEDLRLVIKQALYKKELTYEDLIIIGQFIFVISQEMIREIAIKVKERPA